jgi:hypothetical protein
LISGLLTQIENLRVEANGISNKQIQLPNAWMPSTSSAPIGAEQQSFHMNKQSIASLEYMHPEDRQVFDALYNS